MSDLFSAAAAGISRPTGISAGEAVARIVDAAPELTRLASGESLRGTVVGKDEHGHLLVRTQMAVLRLAGARPLPAGTEVMLQIRSVGPQVVVTVLPLQNPAGTGAAQPQPLPGGPAAAPSPSPPLVTPPPAQPLPASPGDLVQHGQTLRGVLHAAPPMPLLTGLPTAQPGAELLVRILSLGLHAPSGTATPAPPAAAAPLPGAAVPLPAAAGPSASGAAPVTAQPGPAAAVQPGTATLPLPGSSGPADSTTAPLSGLAPGLRLAPQTPVANSGHAVAAALQTLTTDAAARAAGTLPPAATGTIAASPAAVAGAGDPAQAALRMTGLVTAATSSGQAILHTPLGTVTLDTRAALPVGTSLALEVALPEAAAPRAAPLLAAAWPSLEALEETLAQGLPPAQMAAITRALPQVGPRLASGVLFFLSALNQGNVMSWLAPAAAAMQGDRSELYERLGREFAGLNRSIETAAGEWRFVNLPLWSEQGLRELRCFFRHQEHGGKGGREGEKATRFVLELELTQHGPLQLDGLVRARQFDLMLRSRRALPPVARADLRALFEEANAIAGYSGQLLFQASPDWLQMLSTQSSPREHDSLKV